MKTEKPLRSDELKIIRSVIYEKTGVGLKKHLIEQAFTRSSYANTYGGNSNEILEYIGDAILGYYVVKQLYDYYGNLQVNDEYWYYTFRTHERDFSSLKSRIVSNETLAGIMDEWDLCQYLIVGQLDAVNEVDRQQKIRADLLEAIVGAIAVQSRWNQQILENVVSKVLPIEKMILEYEAENYRHPEFSADNAVSTIKEMAERGDCDFPAYDFHGPESLGYTSNGKPKWACRIAITCWGTSLVVFAHSKKDAKKYAAYLALCNRFDLTNEYGPCKRLPVWGFDGERLFPNPPDEF